VEDIAAANAAAFDEVWRAREGEWASGRLAGREMIGLVWRRALAACGCDDAGLLDELVTEHLRLDGIHARLFDDVRPTIDRLRSSGLRFALITNGASDTQRMRLSTLGMADWFDVVVISAEVRSGTSATTWRRTSPGRSVRGTRRCG
jgi:FMN phosphatase YigB (HAD superfamily)